MSKAPTKEEKGGSLQWREISGPRTVQHLREQSIKFKIDHGPGCPLSVKTFAGRKETGNRAKIGKRVEPRSKPIKKYLTSLWNNRSARRNNRSVAKIIDQLLETGALNTLSLFARSLFSFSVSFPILIDKIKNICRNYVRWSVRWSFFNFFIEFLGIESYFYFLVMAIAHLLLEYLRAPTTTVVPVYVVPHWRCHTQFFIPLTEVAKSRCATTQRTAHWLIFSIPVGRKLLENFQQGAPVLIFASLTRVAGAKPNAWRTCFLIFSIPVGRKLLENFQIKEMQQNPSVVPILMSTIIRNKPRKN